MVDWSEILGYVAAVNIWLTSDSEFKCTEEVEGVDEGDLLSEWYLDFDLGAIHSSGPPYSTKYVEAPKIRSTTRGIPTRSGPWLAAPYPFGIAGPTGDNGTSFPTLGMCVCVELNYADLREI